MMARQLGQDPDSFAAIFHSLTTSRRSQVSNPTDYLLAEVQSLLDVLGDGSDLCSGQHREQQQELQEAMMILQNAKLIVSRCQEEFIHACLESDSTIACCLEMLCLHDLVMYHNFCPCLLCALPRGHCLS